MSNLVKTNIYGYVKDKKTGALLSTDPTKFENIKVAGAAHKQHRALETKVKELEERVNRLESITRVTGI